MAQVRSGASTIVIDDIVQEAISALGLFHPDSAPFLAARIARLWGEGDWKFMTDGERIAPLADMPNFRVSGEVWGMLTESGRADAAHACKATRLRVYFNIRRATDYATEGIRRSFSAFAQLTGKTEVTCAAGCARMGETFRLERRTFGLFKRPVALPALPFRGCNAEWCSCRWELLSDR